jgi:hypothetical protein
VGSCHHGRGQYYPGGEKVILLATAHWEADVAAQRISILEAKLVAVLRARDVAEEKLPSLAAKAVAADR